MTDGTITWQTVVVALAAGAVGSLLTALIGFGARLAHIRRKIEGNNRAIAILDRHLEIWVSEPLYRGRLVLATWLSLVSPAPLREAATCRSPQESSV